MKSVRFEDYELEIDYDKTVSHYSNLPLIGEEEHCKCIYCKNYALATADFPNNVKTLISNLGVDPRKDAQVSHFYEAENKKHMYIANYRVFGKVLKKPDENFIDIYRDNDQDYFSIGFENVRALENDEIVIDFHIDAFLPWLIEVTPE